MPEVNLDEALAEPVTLEPLGLAADGSPLSDSQKGRLRREWLRGLEQTLYGAIPAFDGSISAIRTPSTSTPGFSLLRIRIDVDGGHFEVDAGLWLPPAVDRSPEQSSGTVPLIVALDFAGPAGVLNTREYPLDPNARIAPGGWFLGLNTSPNGRAGLHEVLRGTSSFNWPIDLIVQRGWGLLLSCYGSWVPDDESAWRDHGVVPLLDIADDSQSPRAISLWAWSISRLVDVALQQPEVDPLNIATAGHSRLGKAALWASANDERITSVLANDSGAGGASVKARNFGETLDYLRWENPHWMVPVDSATDGTIDLDQQHLIASVWPRHVYIASAVGDLWADPRGEYLGFKAAASMWNPVNAPSLPAADEAARADRDVDAGAVRYHCRAGGHELVAYDWVRYLDFLEAQRACGAHQNRG